jgi:1-phosphofructokinase/tagatose 6-phosphate kinase
VIATGFAGGPAGTRIVEQLTEESILNDFVRIREESRTNTAVLDPTSGEQTEINEPGPEVTQREVELFTDKLLYLAQGAQLVVFAGSLPRGIESDLYAHLIRELRKLGVTTVVDSDGEPMRHAVRELVELGAREAIMTVSDGCFAHVIEDGGPHLYRVRVDPREPRAAVGSGDAFLAGYVSARYTGSLPAECLRFGVACGAESTQHLGAGVIDPREVERLIEEITVEAIEIPAEVS